MDIEVTKKTRNWKRLVLIYGGAALVVGAGVFLIAKQLNLFGEDTDTTEGLSATQNYLEALPELEKKAANSDKYIDHENYAFALRATGNLEKAREEFLKAYELSPSASTVSNLATAHRDLKDLDEAIKHYKKALEFDATHVLSITRLSAIYESKNDEKNAVAVFKNAILAAENDLTRLETFYVQLANLEVRLERIQDAIKNYEEALKLNPENISAKNALEQIQ